MQNIKNISKQTEIDKITKLAIELSPILHSYIMQYKCSNISWEITMQEAAVHLAKMLHETQQKLIKYVQRYGSDLLNS